MVRSPLSLVLLLAALAGCAGSSRPYSPVRNIRYTAIGAEPFWLVTIGDRRIVLRFGGRGSPEHVFARTLPRHDGATTVWQAGEGTRVISIEARPGPCRNSSGPEYADTVRVRLSGRELNGCGGRLVEGRRR